MSDAANANERKSIEERCADFDRAHPEVYAEIKRLALEAHRDGRKRLGIGFLAELARWNLNSGARDSSGYKLNNDFRRPWTERLVREEPLLADMFRMRPKRRCA